MNEPEALIAATQILEQTQLIGAMLALAERQAQAGKQDPAIIPPHYLYDLVIKANAHHKAIADQIANLIDLTRRMVAQRQSVKEAYAQGWESALRDVIDQLNGDEYADLQRALVEVLIDKR